MTHHQSTEMKHCIQACLSCHVVCEETVHHCLTKGGKHAEPHHIALLQTCAQICATSGDAMLRGTHEDAPICRACAEICEACAAACEAMGDDEVMQRCATACRECAQSCRRMAA